MDALEFAKECAGATRDVSTVRLKESNVTRLMKVTVKSLLSLDNGRRIIHAKRDRVYF